MTLLKRHTFLVPIALIILAIGCALHGRAAEVPFLAGRINDLVGILSSSTHAELESLLKAHEDSTSNQVAVLIIPSLEGESLEEFSIKVAETWKLGQKGKDNGVLLLVAKNDRKVRIEVGRGLEGDLTDQISGMIIRHEIVPRFRDGDYDGGVRAGASAILAAVKGSYSAAEEEDGEFGGLGARLAALLLFLVVVGIFTAVALLSEGFVSWFLYFFLIPFWGLFPPAILGATVGLPLFGIYVVGFLIVKMWLRSSDRGKALLKRATKGGFLTSSTGGGWSRGSSWSSSSGSSFSGGGGSFGGGGSSGSW